MSAVFAGLLALAITAASIPARAVDGVVDEGTSQAVAIAVGTSSAPAVRCSGTLLSRSVVLTVRHCIAPLSGVIDCASSTFGAPEPPSAFMVSSATRAGTDRRARWHRVRAFRVPDVDNACEADLALVLLEEPFGEGEASTARPLVDASEVDALLRTRVLGVAGHGRTPTGPAGVRHVRRDLSVTCVPGELGFACDPGLGLAPFELAVGAGICDGDSGAGLFDPVDSSRLVGLASRRTVGADCLRGVALRLDAWTYFLAAGLLASGDDVPWARALFPGDGQAAEDGAFCRSSDECQPGRACVTPDRGRAFICAASCEQQACDPRFVCAAGQSGARFCVPSQPLTEPRAPSCAMTAAPSPRDAAAPALVGLALGCARAARALRARARSSGKIASFWLFGVGAARRALARPSLQPASSGRRGSRDESPTLDGVREPRRR